MAVMEKLKHIGAELKGHAPFTFLGAFLGIVFMLVFKNISQVGTHILFSIFHPGHVLLSAMVTASMFRLHSAKKHILLIIIIGYFGSIGVATLSDIVIPHIGASVLGLDMPTHAEMHQHDHDSEEHTDCEHHIEEDKHSFPIHLGFIEEWYIVNPAALIGIVIAYFLPRTKFPHSLHVLVSTWASSSYLLMSITSDFSTPDAIAIFVTLFIAVWLPCCVSDIIFPLLFVKSDIEIDGACPYHSRHSHEHKKEEHKQ